MANGNDLWATNRPYYQDPMQAMQADLERRERALALLELMEHQPSMTEPGAVPGWPIQEMHPEAGGLRAQIMNLAATPETAKRALEARDFEVVPRGGFSFAIRKKGEKKWRMLDPETLDWRDFTDVGGDILRMIGAGAGMAAGTALGALPGAAAGGAAGGAATETILQAIAAATGLDPTLGEAATAVGMEAAIGGATPFLAHGAGKLAKAVMPRSARAITELSDEALEAKAVRAGMKMTGLTDRPLLTRHEPGRPPLTGTMLGGSFGPAPMRGRVPLNLPVGRAAGEVVEGPAEAAVRQASASMTAAPKVVDPAAKEALSSFGRFPQEDAIRASLFGVGAEPFTTWTKEGGKRVLLEGVPAFEKVFERAIRAKAVKGTKIRLPRRDAPGMTDEIYEAIMKEVREIPPEMKPAITGLPGEAARPAATTAKEAIEEVMTDRERIVDRYMRSRLTPREEIMTGRERIQQAYMNSILKPLPKPGAAIREVAAQPARGKKAAEAGFKALTGDPRLSSFERQKMAEHIIGKQSLTKIYNAFRHESERWGGDALKAISQVQNPYAMDKAPLLSGAGIVGRLVSGGGYVAALGRWLTRGLNPMKRLERAASDNPALARQIRAAIEHFIGGDLNKWKSSVYLLLTQPAFRALVRETLGDTGES